MTISYIKNLRFWLKRRLNKIWIFNIILLKKGAQRKSLQIKINYTNNLKQLVLIGGLPHFIIIFQTK